MWKKESIEQREQRFIAKFYGAHAGTLGGQIWPYNLNRTAVSPFDCYRKHSLKGVFTISKKKVLGPLKRSLR